MNRGRLEASDYEQVLNAYRTHPFNHTHASQKTGKTWETCKRLWFQGIPRLQLPPIKEAYEKEVELARAERQKLADEKKRQELFARKDEIEKAQAVLKKSQEDHAKSRALLGELTTNAVRGAATLVRVLKELQPGLIKLSQQLNKVIEEDSLPTAPGQPPPQKLTIPQKLNVLRTTATVVEKMATASVRAAQLEQIVMGHAKDDPLAKLEEEVSDVPTPQLLEKLKEYTDALEESIGGFVDEDEEGNVYTH